MTQLMMKLNDDRLVMVLEGGFELEPLCDCTEVCIRTLNGENKYSKISNAALTSTPDADAVETIKEVIAVQGMQCFIFSPFSKSKMTELGYDDIWESWLPPNLL